MASETHHTDQSSLINRLINSRNRDLSQFFPFVLGLNSMYPLQDSPNPPTPHDRIILINPITQGMVVLETSEVSFDSLFNHMLSENTQPPASKESIEAMPTVEISGVEECVICLDELKAKEMVKEMPCKHRFHGDCIKKWLKIHGSCPVCRYKMLVIEADDDVKYKINGGRDIWLSFGFSREERNGESDHRL